MTTQVRILMYVSKEYITDGASVYMWHEGSHSSDVAILVREQLEWGKGGQDYDFFLGWVGGEGGGIHKNISTYMLYL